MAKESSHTVNPLVKDLLEARGRVVEIGGYIGPSNGGVVRVYADLGLRRYVEIPEKDVVRVTYPSDKPEDPCKIFFRTSAELKYVTEISLTAADAVATALSKCAGCSSGSKVRRRLARARPVDDGPEMPEYDCELKCEVQRLVCEELTSRHPFWCVIDYYLCRLDCIYDSGSNGGVIVA